MASTMKALDDITRLFLSKRNIIVLCGAGLSTSCGIPDFRSANGLYRTLDLVSLDLCSPEDLFDVECFRENPKRFYNVASTLFYGNKELKPSIAHEFIKLLSDMDVLLRVYTQNIDGLEAVAGIKHIIEAHGSLQRAVCLKCNKTFQWINSDVTADEKTENCSTYKYIQSTLQKSETPSCPRLVSYRKKSQASSKSAVADNNKRIKMNADVENGDNPTVESHRVCGGILKPGITFFGEKLDSRIGKSLEKDKDVVDLVVVMGTSLSVAPISNILSYFPKHIPRILINKTMVNGANKSTDGDLLFDACLLGTCDEIVLHLAQKMNTILQTDMPMAKAKDRFCPNLSSLISSYLASQNDSKVTVTGEPTCYKYLSNQEKTKMKMNLHKHPEENVFLFPGFDRCEINDDETISPRDLKTSDLAPFQESVYCDECHKLIQGPFMTCTICFDYDLCSLCFPSSCKIHFDGGHIFKEQE